jgi:hypothetical protein
VYKNKGVTKMAYTYVPKSEKELRTKTLHRQYFDGIVALMEYFAKTNPSVTDPIVLHDSEAGDIKVTRRLSGLDLKKIKKEIGAPSLKLSWGEGSRKVGGTTATVNKGIKFEVDLVRDINLYIKGEPIRDTKNDKFIKEFVAYYKLTYLDKVLPMGELNQKRPLQFMGNEVFIGGRDFNIGATVTDVTVEGATKAGGRTLKGKTIYLSLKFGPTVTFANPGISTLFPEREFKTGKFTGTKGKALLKMLGLDEAKFIKTFNAYANNTSMNKFKEDVTQKMDQASFQNFLKSGIGYGYHMVHLLGQNIKDNEMTKDYLTKATKVTRAIAYYGGVSGGGTGPVTAKRIDIIITTPVYTFKINLRSKSAGKVYPTHLMIDYSYV